LRSNFILSYIGASNPSFQVSVWISSLFWVGQGIHAPHRKKGITKEEQSTPEMGW